MAEQFGARFMTGTEPGYWSPSSSLIRIYGLTRNLSTEVSLARRIAAVGLETTDELTIQQPEGSSLEVPSGLDVASITAEALTTYNLSRNGLPFVAGDFPRSPLEADARGRLAASLSAGNGTEPMAEADREMLQYQSNNWTVAGTKTSTGRPILAKDPHRAISMPSLRYLVHLNAPGWNVIGAGESALPGVSIGHNDRIAFGLTIFAFGDEEDLYVYDTNPANPNEYRYDGGWEPMRIVTESIPVRGGASELVELKFTRHGPVVHQDPAGGKAYAVRAAYLEFPGTAAYLPSLRLNQARNWVEFTEGMARHFTPSENMVYADVDGNIGWFGGSITPIRPQADWSGLLPVPGDGRYEWSGYLPGDLRNRQGDDRGQWAWGELHHIRFEHALSTLVTPELADRLGTARFPVGGTGDTVGVAHYRTTDFRVTSGASFRQVIDVADWDRSVTINVPGQSSDPDSPFYANLLEPWSKGQYFQMAYSRGAVEAIKADTVTLKPRR